MRSSFSPAFRNLHLTLLFALALMIRTWRAVQQPVVNTDAIRFIEQARRLISDPVAALRGEPYHPLHSLCTLIVHALTSRLFENDRHAWLFAVQSVGIFCGSIVAIQVVLLARRCGAPFWAALGGGVAWIVGRRTSAYGADGLSDMLFLSLFAGSLLLVIRASRLRNHLTSRHILQFLAAGFLTGLAYLTRPEGLAALLIITLFLTTSVLVGKGFRSTNPHLLIYRKLLPRHAESPRRILLAIAALFGGAALPALPYMFIIGGLTQKKALSAAVISPHGFSLAQAFPAPVLNKPILEKLAMEIWETFGFAPCIALAGAMLLAPHLWGRARLRPLVNIWIATWTIVMLWLIKHAHYLDGRHTLPLVFLLHALLALAFVKWTAPMRWWMNWWRRRPDAWRKLPGWMRYTGWPYIFAACAIVLTLLPGLIRLSTPPQENLRYVRDAAAWIDRNVAPTVVICDHDRLVGYYSGNPYQQWLGTPANPLLGQIHLAQPHLLAYVFRPDPLHGEKLLPSIGPYRAIQAFRSPAASDTMVLYALPDVPILVTGKPQFLTDLNP